MTFWRKRGISLLVPTLNSSKTVELCIRSFVEFPDEIIAVDNGSTDGTIEILCELEEDIPKLSFYHAPELVDLYQNRQYAFERSSYDWVVRIDSDYIAYTEGPRDIKRLRRKILEADRTLRPKAIGITNLTLFKDFRHTGKPMDEREEVPSREYPLDPQDPSRGTVTTQPGKHVEPPITTLGARILQYYPGMRFIRRGRWEGVRFQHHLNHRQLDHPYWFHCQLRSDMDLFYRSERTNWRELGDYDRYPTLDSYIKSIIPIKYNTSSIEEACEEYIETKINPLLEKYDPEEYYEYPSLIENNV